MRRVLVLLMTAAFLAPGAAARAAPLNVYAVDADASWLLAVQTDDGAITMGIDKTWVQPYFANIGAEGLARAYAVTGNTLYRDAALKWLGWYQAHMDSSTGYVTDYRLVDGNWTSGDFVAGKFVAGFFDSSDSYAATFLTAAAAIMNARVEPDLVQPLREGVHLAITAMLSTSDSRDGLTYAKPDYLQKFLMDNAEVFEGWIAATQLGYAMNDQDSQTIGATHAQQILDSFPTFYNGAEQGYDWAMSDGGVHATISWQQFYPSATAQAWAVKTGLLDGQRARALMQRLDAEQPGWDDPKTTSVIVDHNESIGYNPAVAVAFLKAGLRSRARSAWANFEATASSTARTYPYHPGAAGSLIMLAADPSFLDADDT